VYEEKLQLVDAGLAEQPPRPQARTAKTFFVWLPLLAATSTRDDKPANNGD
jgi:hypothetical protein